MPLIYNFYIQIVAFTYHKFVLAYGSNRNMLMMLSWRTQKGPNNKQYFYLTFGIGPSRGTVSGRSDIETYDFLVFTVKKQFDFLFCISLSPSSQQSC